MKAKTGQTAMAWPSISSLVIAGMSESAAPGTGIGNRHVLRVLLLVALMIEQAARHPRVALSRKVICEVLESRVHLRLIVAASSLYRAGSGRGPRQVEVIGGIAGGAGGSGIH